MKKDLSAIRNDYGNRVLNETDLPEDPIQLAQEWLDEAITNGQYEPTAITLSTIDLEGFPSSRIVLLKGIQDSKLQFFSNYNSAKGKDLAENSKAGILFFWPELHRQIRIKGIVGKLSAEQSDFYYKERPYESKIAAWASPQSEVIGNRLVLESNFERYAKEFKDDKIPRPKFWGGYELDPTSFEFWQGRSGRLHDRLVYGKVESKWGITRLAP